MTELAGELADAFFMHPFSNAAYFKQVTQPALQRGLAKSAREMTQLQIITPVFLIIGSQEQQQSLERQVREQIAFYGSTPAYHEVLEVIGYGDLHKELHRLSRQSAWEQMADLIPDEVVGLFSVRASYVDLFERLEERFAGVSGRVVAHFPLSILDLQGLKVASHS